MFSKKGSYLISVLAGVAVLVLSSQPQRGSLVDMALALAGGSAGPGDSGSGDDGHNDTGGQHGGSGDTAGRDHGDGGYQGSPGMGPTGGYGPSIESLAQVDTMTQEQIDADLANMKEEAQVQAMIEGIVDAKTRTKIAEVQVATEVYIDILNLWVPAGPMQIPGSVYTDPVTGKKGRFTNTYNIPGQ